MKCLLLGAGYATRLYPLTRDCPKPLLPVGGRPMIEWILDRVLAVPAVDGIYLVSNHRFIESYRTWHRGLTAGGLRVPLELIDDGTTSNDDRLGAIGDIHYVIHQARIDDDLLIVAGDNLFDFELQGLVETFTQHGTTIGLKDMAEKPALIPQYSVVQLDTAGRLVGFEEKPSVPKGTLIAIAVYLYARRDLSQIDAYLQAGQKPDQPGYLVQWLFPRISITGHVLPGTWFDIGTLDEYRQADARYQKKTRHRGV